MELGVAFFIALLFAGLSGVRAFLPLLVLSGWHAAEMGADAGAMTHPATIVALLTLAGVEALADKIPLIDHMQDLLGFIIRPICGALSAVIVMQLAGATITALPALIMGTIAAVVVHIVKTGARAASTATTAGAGNPVISILEDMLVLGLALAGTLAFVV